MEGMMYGNIIKVDLDKPLIRLNVGEVMASGDALANRYGAQLHRSGTDVDASSYSVTGYLIRPNDETLKIDGVAKGSMVYVDIPEHGYAYDGAFTLTIKVNGDGMKKAIVIFDGKIAKTTTDAIVDGDRVLYDMDAILDLIDDMEAAEAAATTAAGNANAAASSANSATAKTNTATTNANTAASRANTAAAALENAPVPTGTVVTYQAGTSPTTPPTGTWLANPPTVVQGQYLWTRTVQSFTNGNPVTSYSVARQGMDGSGSVAAVDGVSPNSSGNVVLGAVRSVNGSKPDDNGNVEVDAGGGTVQSVNNVQPDAGGNITLVASDVGALPENYVPPVTSVNGKTGNVTIEIPESVGDAETLGGNPPAYYTPYDNRVENGNFRQFITQAGIPGNHGTTIYGGDRWILDNGDIDGNRNEDGIGNGNITLNGTIRQIIAEPQETMTAFVGMISGTATVNYTYTDGVGELTITSAGGVLDWVMLLPGEWESAPPYVPKGYSTELAECLRYYIKLVAQQSGFTSGSTSGNIVINLPVDMRISPTVDGTISWIRCNGNSITSGLNNINVSATNKRASGLTISLSGCPSLTAYSAMHVGGTFDLIADL